jgi:hypothetical protein
MSFVKRILMVFFTVVLLRGEAGASEVLLKIACLKTNAFNQFRLQGAGTSAEKSGVNYSALTGALTYSVLGPAESAKNISISSSNLVKPAWLGIPDALQALYPEQGLLVGRQMPGGTSGWHKLIIDFRKNARVAFVGLTVEQAVLDSLATGSANASLHDRPVQQYTHGSRPDTTEVFTTGFSLFLQQLAQPNSREWLREVMPLKNGIGLLALRRSGSQTRTDTLLIMIDPRQMTQTISGRKEAQIVLGWDFAQ